MIDSRTTLDGIRRRRICKDCKRRFTTYERVGSPGLKVLKRGDRKPEQFSGEKLRHTLMRVCRHRPVREHDLDALVSQIQAELSHVRSIDSGDVARMVVDRLGAIDRVSRDRFAASYIDDDGRLRFDGHEPKPEASDQLPLFGESDSD